MGGVDPSDAVLCVRLAATYGRVNGGLRGSVGSSSPPVDPGSPVGAAHFAAATARGKTHFTPHLLSRNSDGFDYFT